LYGGLNSLEIIEQFEGLANSLEKDGALVFTELDTTEAFLALIENYRKISDHSGNKSSLHLFVNFANHLDFLSNTSFNRSFFHPAFIALIAYQMGDVIRLVDARAKDAEPISVLASDNMLHIDNNPFEEEYKIILSWEKDKPSGPKGQNFTFLPGTHKGVRNYLIDKEGRAWTTENRSIFITEEGVNKIMEFQKRILQINAPYVVEANYPRKPLSILFNAGALVHHRYRTKEGSARSCVTLTFHRAKDNPGKFAFLNARQKCSLNNFLFGDNDGQAREEFIEALSSEASEIATLIVQLSDTTAKNGGVQKVALHELRLSAKEVEIWKEAITKAPTLEKLKIQKYEFPKSSQIAFSDFVKLIENWMSFDKHSPLDLILYCDNHEEIRKWARKRIREMDAKQLSSRLKVWIQQIPQPNINHILSPREMCEISLQLVEIISRSQIGNHVLLDKNEQIDFQKARQSIIQLLNDLAEAIIRCENRQIFLATSLFVFWSCDLACEIQNQKTSIFRSIGSKLLSHYIVCAILNSMLFTESFP
jgi:hypothetical protein